MDITLKFLLALTRNMPKVRGMGKVSCAIRDFYARHPRSNVKTRIGDLTMTLNPNDSVEGELLFHPHLYEREEREFLMRQLRAGDTFLDAGAHLGFFSLDAAKRVGRQGKVLAIEAHPVTHARLKENFATNQLPQCLAVHQGLSDAPGELPLTLESGNSGANSFLIDRSDRSIIVKCDTLLHVLLQNGIQSIQAAKFDLEGFEFRVLKAFFQEAPRSLWPRFILVEHFPDQNAAVGGSSKDLLLSNDYEIAWQRHPRPNIVFKLKK